MLPRLSRTEMAQRLAKDIAPGSYVNLGIGLPVLVANYLDPADEIILQSENGILGMGPNAAEGQEDYELINAAIDRLVSRINEDDRQEDDELINAAKEPVTVLSGGAYFDHVDSFTIMRGGHMDLTIMGAMQVAANGDLANWNLGRPGEPPAVGGAMDLAVGAKQVFILMEHTTRDGTPKIVKNCTLPLTGLEIGRAHV